MNAQGRDAYGYCGQGEVVHRLNAFTWAGRRAECAVTSEFLNTTGSSQTWEGVTCPECLSSSPLVGQQ